MRESRTYSSVRGVEINVYSTHNRNYDKYGRWEVKLGMSGVWEETQGV